MRNAVAEDECVYVFRTRDFLQHARKVVHEPAHSAGFGVGQVAESRRVTLRLDNEPTPVCRGLPEHVARVHELILIEDAPNCRITTPMLLADQTGRRCFAWRRHAPRLPDMERFEPAPAAT